MGCFVCVCVLLVGVFLRIFWGVYLDALTDLLRVVMFPFWVLVWKFCVWVSCFTVDCGFGFGVVVHRLVLGCALFIVCVCGVSDLS